MGSTSVAASGEQGAARALTTNHAPLAALPGTIVNANSALPRSYVAPLGLGCGTDAASAACRRCLQPTLTHLCPPPLPAAVQQRRWTQRPGEHAPGRGNTASAVLASWRRRARHQHHGRGAGGLHCSAVAGFSVLDGLHAHAVPHYCSVASAPAPAQDIIRGAYINTASKDVGIDPNYKKYKARRAAARLRVAKRLQLMCHCAPCLRCSALR